MPLGGDGEFKWAVFWELFYFEGKPELLEPLHLKIRNLFVTLSAPNRKMASYHSLCNKVTRPITNQFDLL
jgi:hypothetical protein